MSMLQWAISAAAWRPVTPSLARMLVKPVYGRGRRRIPALVAGRANLGGVFCERSNDLKRQHLAR